MCWNYEGREGTVADRVVGHSIWNISWGTFCLLYFFIQSQIMGNRVLFFKRGLLVHRGEKYNFRISELVLEVHSEARSSQWGNSFKIWYVSLKRQAVEGVKAKRECQKKYTWEDLEIRFFCYSIKNFPLNWKFSFNENNNRDSYMRWGCPRSNEEKEDNRIPYSVWVKISAVGTCSYFLLWILEVSSCNTPGHCGVPASTKRGLMGDNVMEFLVVPR